MRRSLHLVLLTALVLAVLPGLGSAAQAAGTDRATVLRVVDGDTIDVSLGGVRERIRFLNIDTPETGRCLAKRATRFTRSRLPVGSKVTLSYDLERHDRYGRTLAVVRDRRGSSLSTALAARGLGAPMLVRPNRMHYASVLAAARRARAKRVGVFDRRIGCTFVNDTRAARAKAKRAERMPVRTRAQYRRTLAVLGTARTAAAAVTMARYGMESAWLRKVLKRSRAGVRAVVRTVKVAKKRQRARVVRRQRHAGGSAGSGGSSSSSGGSSSGGSTGYNGPRCYEPGGVVWHPC